MKHRLIGSVLRMCSANCNIVISFQPWCFFFCLFVVFVFFVFFVFGFVLCVLPSPDLILEFNLCLNSEIVPLS